MTVKTKSNVYKFTPQELEVARAQLRATTDTIERLRKFLSETLTMTGDAVALQRTSALKTIHHLEGQVADWTHRFPKLKN